MKKALTHGHPHDACLHHHHVRHHVRDHLHNANTVSKKAFSHAALGPIVSAVVCMSVLLTLARPSWICGISRAGNAVIGCASAGELAIITALMAQGLGARRCSTTATATSIRFYSITGEMTGC